MQNNTLYLTNDEAAQFQVLPDSVRDGWTVVQETKTSYEGDDVLKVRLGMARFESYPTLRDFAQQVLVQKSVIVEAFKDLPESALPELFFTIGARGVTVLMDALLANTQTDDDVAGVAGLSQIRHDILETNSSISYV